MKEFEIIPHTADLQIRVCGKTPEDLFKNSLIGMFASIEPITKDISCKKNGLLVCQKLDRHHEIKINSKNLELLLIDFLSEALYLSDTFDEAYLDVDILKLTQTDLKAILKGIKIIGFDGVEIKAVTYHNLKIIEENGYLKTDIVFDI